MNICDEETQEKINKLDQFFTSIQTFATTNMDDIRNKLEEIYPIPENPNENNDTSPGKSNGSSAGNDTQAA